jgi:hypothetical protein
MDSNLSIGSMFVVCLWTPAAAYGSMHHIACPYTAGCFLIQQCVKAPVRDRPTKKLCRTELGIQYIRQIVLYTFRTEYGTLLVQEFCLFEAGVGA